MIKPGLRLEIVFTLTIVMAAASFLIGIVVMSVTKRSIIDQKVKNATASMNLLQHSIDSVIYGRDEAFQEGEVNWQLQRLVRLFTLERQLQSIFVVNRTGRVVASSRSDQIGTTYQDSDLSEVISNPQILTRTPKARRIAPQGPTDVLLVSAPLYLKNRVLGAIRMTVSLRDVQRTVNKAYRLIVTYIVFSSAIIILFGSFLLSRLIVKPMRKLLDATESLARGDFSQSLTAGTRNEIGQLSFAFNRMAERIAEHQRQLQTQIESLEGLNRQLQQTQKEVLAGEKLALVGKLAAGIAHEIGNPLSAVLGYIGIMQKEQRQDNISAADYLVRMEQELQRINKTIGGLLDFSRLQKVEIHPVDMKQAIENSLDLVAHQKKFQEIKLTAHIDEGLWAVEGDEHQFQQVLLNLLLNAGDAVNKEGTIVVMADRMAWREGRLRSLGPPKKQDLFSAVPDFGLGKTELPWERSLLFQNQKVVRIVVADNGEGIAPDDLDKIFDPFFTTRESGKGTGLGLAISTRIIESYDGVIIVRSQERRGSAFLIILPAKGKDHG